MVPFPARLDRCSQTKHLRKPLVVGGRTTTWGRFWNYGLDMVATWPQAGHADRRNVCVIFGFRSEDGTGI